MSDLVFQKMHYSSLPFKHNVDLHISYSHRLYSDMFTMMSKLKDDSINIILNRSHLGESVYSPIFRNYSGDFVFDIEKKFTQELRENLYLITLVNDPHILWSRDDGKSLHKSEEEIAAQVDGFKRAHRLSKIKNKLLINVGSMTAEDLNKIILEFIVEVNEISGDAKQLKVFNND